MKKNIMLIASSALSGAVLTALVFLLLFLPTGASADLPTVARTETPTSSTVNVETGVWSPKDWDNTYATYLGDKVPNAETAVDIACGILYNIDWGENTDSCVPWYVFLDEEDDIWIVAFEYVDKYNLEQKFAGGGYYIAIQKSDGKILRVFADQ